MILLLPLLLAVAEPVKEQWLVGTWLQMEGEVAFPDSCASGLPITYQADGTYELFEEDGRWRLRGDKLEEVATGLTDAADPAEVKLGVRFTSTIRKINRDRFIKRFDNGLEIEFRRCPRAG